MGQSAELFFVKKLAAISPQFLVICSVNSKTRTIKDRSLFGEQLMVWHHPSQRITAGCSALVGRNKEQLLFVCNLEFLSLLNHPVHFRKENLKKNQSEHWLWF